MPERDEQSTGAQAPQADATTPDVRDRAAFERLFAEETRDLIVSRLRVGLGMGAVLYAIFSGLDWIVVPDLWDEFLLIRLATVLLVALVLGLTCSDVGRQHARGLALIVVYFGASGIVLMTTRMGGFASSYFTGILLVTFLVGLFLPWGAGLTLVYSGLICGTYVAANLNIGDPSPVDALMPTFFLAGTCFLTCWASWAIERSRRHALVMRLALEEANESLQELDKAKTSFFANVSHELRTPLMLILGPLEQLRAGTASDGPALLKSMDANAHRLLRQVNMILSFSKLEAGRQDCNRELGQVGDVLDLLVSGALPYAQQRGMELLGTGFDELPEIPFDGEQIETSVANLLSNAMKFTPDGGRVEVRAGHAGDVVWIEVEDTGCGIPEADVQKVFERFHQVDGGKGGKIQGTGLGLALSKELVELHGGRMSVTSVLGEGTTFRIELPTLETSDWEESSSAAQDVDASKQTGKVQTVARADSNATQFADLSKPGLEQDVDLNQAGDDAPLVLVVEDNPDMRAFVSSSLARTYRVVTAEDGAKGLDEARRARPDLIVSDVQMPVMDGFEMVEELRKDRTFDATPIIMLTAKTGSRAVVKGLSLGAVDYIGKPFEVSELEARVAAKLRMASIQRTLDEHESRLVAVGQMTGSIAHDLRGPLSAINNRIEVVRIMADMNGQVDVFDEELTAMEGTVGRIDNMIQELLEFVRGNNVTLDVQAVDLGGFMTGVCEQAGESLGHVGVRLDHEQHGEDGLRVEFDGDRMARVLDNLVNNARDAIVAEGREGTVWIRTAVEQGQVHIRVADDGPGIPEAAREKLFQPFATAGKPNGTGLGLAIVRNIVTAHGGSVDVDFDPPEGGAAFEVVLPCQLTVTEQVTPA